MRERLSYSILINNETYTRTVDVNHTSPIHDKLKVLILKPKEPTEEELNQCQSSRVWLLS